MTKKKTVRCEVIRYDLQRCMVCIYQPLTFEPPLSRYKYRIPKPLIPRHRELVVYLQVTCLGFWDKPHQDFYITTRFPRSTCINGQNYSTLPQISARLQHHWTIDIVSCNMIWPLQVPPKKVVVAMASVRAFIKGCAGMTLSLSSEEHGFRIWRSWCSVSWNPASHLRCTKPIVDNNPIPSMYHLPSKSTQCIKMLVNLPVPWLVWV